MQCSKCGRVWHVGGPVCPRCGAPVEAVEPSALWGYRLKGPPAAEPGQGPLPAISGVLNRRLSCRDFIIAALAGSAAATIAVVVPIAVGGNGKEGPAVATTVRGTAARLLLLPV